MLSMSRNQKYLDYEIETMELIAGIVLGINVETKSISITRLKHRARHFNPIHLFSRNQKYLDYEIETYHPNGLVAVVHISVETKSISITRLKLLMVRLLRSHAYVETKSISITRLKLRNITDASELEDASRNQKYLDYEIETISIEFLTSNFLW